MIQVHRILGEEIKKSHRCGNICGLVDNRTWTAAVIEGVFFAAHILIVNTLFTSRLLFNHYKEKKNMMTYRLMFPKCLDFLSSVYVRAYSRMRYGKLEHVRSHWRSLPM